MTRMTIGDQLITAQAKLAELQESIKQLTLVNEQLRGAQAGRDRAHDEAVAKLKEEHEKAIKTKESSYNYMSQQHTSAANELEQAHAVLDSVEGAPSRDYEAEYGKKQRNVVTRLAGAFLAIAQARAVGVAK